MTQRRRTICLWPDVDAKLAELAQLYDGNISKTVAALVTKYGERLAVEATACAR